VGWLKANPDKASAGIFSTGIRLLTELFQKETGAHFAIVPYRGSAPILQDLLAGHIDLSFDSVLQLPQHKSLCDNQRLALRTCARYSDLSRDGTAVCFLRPLVGPICAQGCAERYHRQT